MFGGLVDIYGGVVIVTGLSTFFTNAHFALFTVKTQRFILVKFLSAQRRGVYYPFQFLAFIFGKTKYNYDYNVLNI